MSSFPGMKRSGLFRTEPVVREKDCTCYTCDKDFHHLGIMRHRAMHRDRKEYCKIYYSSGRVLEHMFGPKPEGA